ncbi:MAG: hypothetical protein ACSHWS_01325 [Sulfitobacter sp.]
MRSIIFTSFLALLALPVAAAEPEGCFARTYSDAHLAKHPAQVVREISMSFGDFAGDDVPWVDVEAEIADQGHARGTGQGGNTYGQIARCTDGGNSKTGWTCSVECDGGTMRIDRLDATSMLVSLEYFIMNTGDDCGGEVDLAEVPGQSVSYKLERQPDAACAGRW